MNDLKPYFVEFKFNEKIKKKDYPNNYKVKGLNWQPIIYITHDKYTFSANNGKKICMANDRKYTFSA